MTRLLPALFLLGLYLGYHYSWLVSWALVSLGWRRG